MYRTCWNTIPGHRECVQAATAFASAMRTKYAPNRAEMVLAGLNYLKQTNMDFMDTGLVAATTASPQHQTLISRLHLSVYARRLVLRVASTLASGKSLLIQHHLT